jgi:hypothetical protein
VRCAHRGEHVRRVAAGGDGEQDVAGLAEREHLLGEDLLVVVVVGDRREGGRVGGQRHRRQPGALALEAVEQLGGEVLRVGRGAAVAARQDLAARHEPLDHQLGGARDRLGERLGGGELGLGAVGKVAGDAAGKVDRHGGGRRAAAQRAWATRQDCTPLQSTNTSNSSTLREFAATRSAAMRAVTGSPRSIAQASASFSARGT